MAAREKINILVNLGDGFLKSPHLRPCFDRLAQLGEMRTGPHADIKAFERDLAWAGAWIGWGSPTPADEMLAKAPGLRWSGHLNLTQEGALALLRRGIAVSEARRCWSPAVAEMALALILAGLRKTSDYHAAMRTASERWPQLGNPSKTDPLERELTGRSVGIVGFGGIGRRLAELLQPFRVNLRIFDPFVPAGVAEEQKASSVSLLELIQASEIVVLCAANTPEARRLIGAREIAALRPNALLVNVGRAWLVDTEALIARLRKNDLIAMIDVFDHEPLESDSPLRALPNAYLTPHRAGGLIEAVQRALDMLTSDLEAFLDGRELAHRLDEQTVKACLA